MYINIDSWIIYLLLYIYISFYLFYFLRKFNFSSKKDLINCNHLNDKNKNILIFLLFIYCQFPPISSFLIKILFIETLTESIILNSIIILCTFTSIIITYIYLERFTPLFFSNKCYYHSIYYKKVFFKNKTYWKFFLITTILLTLIPII